MDSLSLKRPILFLSTFGNKGFYSYTYFLEIVFDNLFTSTFIIGI